MASAAGLLTQFAPLAGAVGLLYAGLVHQSISEIRVSATGLLDLSAALREGVSRHRQGELRRLALWLLCVAASLFWAFGPLPAFASVIGALCSLCARNVGWRSALRVTVRSAMGHREPGSSDATAIAIAGGAVLSLSCVGLALLGLGSVFAFMSELPACAAGFVLGAGCSTMAVRPGPELAGLGWTSSDRFETLTTALAAAFALGATPGARAALPLSLATAALITILAVSRASTGRGTGLLEARLRKAILAASALYLGISTAAILLLDWASWRLAMAHGSGVLGALFLAALAELRSSGSYHEVQRVAEACRSGPAAGLTAGLLAGLRQAFAPVLLLAVVCLFADLHAGASGIGLAALGMASMLAVVHGIETIGTSAARASGSGEPGQAASGSLDGSLPAFRSAAAVGRDVAIGASTLAALALDLACFKSVNLSTLALGSPLVLVFLPLGSALSWRLAVAPAPALCLLLPLAVGLCSPEALAGLLAGILMTAGPLAFVASGCASVWRGCAAQLDPSDTSRAVDALGARLLETSIPALGLLLKLGAATAWFLALAQGN